MLFTVASISEHLPDCTRRTFVSGAYVQANNGTLLPLLECWRYLQRSQQHCKQTRACPSRVTICELPPWSGFIIVTHYSSFKRDLHSLVALQTYG